MRVQVTSDYIAIAWHLSKENILNLHKFSRVATHLGRYLLAPKPEDGLAHACMHYIAYYA